MDNLDNKKKLENNLLAESLKRDDLDVDKVYAINEKLKKLKEEN